MGVANLGKWVAGYELSMRDAELPEESVDVLCPSGACEKVFWWFLDLSQFVSNSSRMLDEKIDIQLNQIQVISF